MINLQKILTESLLLLAVVLGQWLIVPLLAFNSITPDLILIYLILRSLHQEKPGTAVVFGFSAGLIFDLLTGGLIGLHSLAWIPATFSSALIGREIEKLTKTHLLILGCTIILFCNTLTTSLSLYGLPYRDILLTHLLPVITYNLIIYLTIISLFSFKKKRKMI